MTNSSDGRSFSSFRHEVDDESAKGEEDDKIEHDEVDRPRAGNSNDDNDADGNGEDDGDEADGDDVSFFSSIGGK